MTFSFKLTKFNQFHFAGIWLLVKIASQPFHSPILSLCLFTFFFWTIFTFFWFSIPLLLASCNMCPLILYHLWLCILWCVMTFGFKLTTLNRFHSTLLLHGLVNITPQPFLSAILFLCLFTFLLLNFSFASLSTSNSFPFCCFLSFLSFCSSFKNNLCPSRQHEFIHLKYNCVSFK